MEKTICRYDKNLSKCIKILEKEIKAILKKRFRTSYVSKTIKLETIILLSFFWCLDSIKNGHSTASSKYL